MVTEPVSVSDFYLDLKEAGLQYGEAFRNITRMWQSNKALLSELKLSKSLFYENSQFGFHPALLDACLHTILYAGKRVNEEGRLGVYLPVAIKRFKIHSHPSEHVWCYTRLKEVSADQMRGDYLIYDEQGAIVAEIQGLTCKYIEGSRGEATDGTYQGTYAYAWEKVEDTMPVVEMTRVNGDATGGCLLFLDQDAKASGVGSQLLEKFSADNLYPIILEKSETYQALENNHYQVNPAEKTDIERALADATSRGYNVRRIMYLWGLDSLSDPTMTTATLEAQQRTLAEHTLNTLKAIVSHDHEPLVYLLSQGADTVEASESINVHQAALFGMGRVMMNEFPFIKMSLVDMPAVLEDATLTMLYENFTLVEKTQYPEVAMRNGGMYLRKLQAVTEDVAEDQAKERLSARGTRYQATVKEYGTLDSIQFRQAPATTLGDTEVEIEVRAAGLNFKDVMNVMGLLSDEAVEGGIAGKNLGLECSGVVTRVGHQAKEFKVGDEVMAWSANSYAGYTVTPASCVVKKPKHLSFEEAATITVVYLTAHYSLNYLARLSGDDTVLIHAASGGVGIAAIRLAQQAGSQIIATAGTEQKRAYVRSLGVEHVFDSRSLAFADQVMEATDGVGVDVVLNSLSGKGITQSIKCLAPFGRFIEIGKADIYQDTKLALKRFGENLSYHAVDVDRLMLRKPRLGKRLFQEVVDIFSHRQIEVHPHQVYPVSQISEALRILSQGGHIGKLVTTMQAEDSLEVLPAQQLTLDANGTYLITGGASGFGLMLAEWLVEKGARHLVLLSRSGHKFAADYSIVEQMEQRGAEVYSMQLDITDAQAVAGVVKYVRTNLPPLRGVIHSAAVLNDATLMNTDTDRYMSVFCPKALGAWNLHQATQEDTLDFFLSLSSISSLFGLPGQSNYSSANNFLDRLAQYRQSQGLAGSSINLGVLGMYAGMSKEGGNVLNVLANQGWLPLTLRQVTEKIEAVLVQQPAVRMAANLDWQRFKNFFSHLQDDVRFAHFLQDTQIRNGSTRGTTLADQVRAVPIEQQTLMVQGFLVTSLAKIIGSAPEQIETDTSIASMGLDSLMLSQLRNWIQQKLEVSYPLMKIAKGPTLAELAEQVRQNIFQGDNQHSSELNVMTDTSGIASEESMEIVAEGWLVRNRNNQQQIHHRVFCFHPVGAGASMFTHFLLHPWEHTDVLAVQLPGRENRISESPYDSMDQLVSDLAKAIRPWLDKPFTIMGHSFGGIVGFELIHYLKAHFGVTAEHLLITGTIAPQLTKVWRTRDSISKTGSVLSYSEEKLLSLLTYIDDVDFLRSILPVMRLDMPLIMSYVYRKRQKLDIPISAFAAEQDEVVLVEEVKQWMMQTEGTFALEVVNGDHWFLSRNKERIHRYMQQVAVSSSLV